MSLENPSPCPFQRSFSPVQDVSGGPTSGGNEAAVQILVSIVGDAVAYLIGPRVRGCSAKDGEHFFWVQGGTLGKGGRAEVYRVKGKLLA